MSLKSNSERFTIIIHAPNWLGDHIMAFPFYLALKNIFQNAEILLVGRSWISGLIPRNIFTNIYMLDNKKRLSQENYLLLQNKKPQISFTLSPSFRSALTLRKLKPTFLMGYKTDYRNLLLKLPQKNKFPKINYFEHRTLSYLRLLTPWLTSSLLAEDLFFKHTKTKLFIEKKNISHEIQEIINKEASKCWVICPGSVATSKIYPVNYLVKIIKELLDKNKSLKILLVGTAIETKYAVTIEEHLPQFHNRIINLCERTSIYELFSILQKSRGVVANDSGVAHLTFLSQTPLVSFIGMGRREETLMLTKNKIILDKNLSCSPCKKQLCPRNDVKIKCLIDIPPEEVIAAMLKLDNKLIAK